MRLLLSGKATCNSHGQDSSYFLGWQEFEKNPCGQTRNPQGIIQMGLAENLPQPSFDLLESWLSENQDIAGFKRNGDSIFRELALFHDYHGPFGSCPLKWAMRWRGLFELRHPKMKVVVEILTGVLFSADVTGDGTVADLKQETGTQQKLPRDHLILLLRDRNQSDPIKDEEDGARLGDVGMKDGSHIYLFFKYEESWP